MSGSEESLFVGCVTGFLLAPREAQICRQGIRQGRDVSAVDVTTTRISLTSSWLVGLDA